MQWRSAVLASEVLTLVPVQISVVVCTYNRCDLLRRALTSLCAQGLEVDHYAVIVVDNNSTDDTATVVRAFSQTKPNVRYESERAQGLSHARNRGWHVAAGEYVAYIDDDCKTPAKWLEQAVGIIRSYKPAAFGGPVIGYFDTPPPRWFKTSYVTYQPWDRIRTLGADEFGKLHGGNLFIQAFLEFIYIHYSVFIRRYRFYYVSGNCCGGWVCSVGAVWY